MLNVNAAFTSWIIPGAVRRVQRLQDDENLWLTVAAIHSQYIWSFQEQSKEYNAFKTMARQESKENRQLLSQEVDALNKELQQLQVRVNDLQADNKAKDESNLQLR